MSAHSDHRIGSDADLAIYQSQGLGQTIGMGAAPALLIVDFVVGFTDPAHSGGGNIRDAIAATVPMLAHARACGWPVATRRARNGSWPRRARWRRARSASTCAAAMHW